MLKGGCVDRVEEVKPSRSHHSTGDLQGQYLAGSWWTLLERVVVT